LQGIIKGTFYLTKRSEITTGAQCLTTIA